MGGGTQDWEAAGGRVGPGPEEGWWEGGHGPGGGVGWPRPRAWVVSFPFIPDFEYFDWFPVIFLSFQPPIGVACGIFVITRRDMTHSGSGVGLN